MHVSAGVELATGGWMNGVVELRRSIGGNARPGQDRDVTPRASHDAKTTTNIAQRRFSRALFPRKQPLPKCKLRPARRWSSQRDGRSQVPRGGPKAAAYERVAP